MIEPVDRRLWVYGEVLFPGAAHQWVQDTSWGRARWFLAFPYAYFTSPPGIEKAVVQVEKVFITRLPVPADINDTKWRIHVIVRNIGTDTVQAYSIWVAQTVSAISAGAVVHRSHSSLSVSVVHDSDGEILSVGVPLDEGEGLIELLPESGQHVSRVSLPDVPELADLETTSHSSFRICDNFTLDVREPAPRLVRRYP
jgi:hypothetical protein